MTQKPPATYSDLRAVFFNGTLKPSPEVSNTDGLLQRAADLMRAQGVHVDVVRTIDHDIATGVYPDMREQGAATDAFPEEIWPLVDAADIVVVCGPIWLGDNSSQTRKLIERLYAMSSETKDDGQYVFYGKVGGAIITGNEDGVKHSASSILYSLQHIGLVIPPAADAGWIGEIGPGPSYLDEGSGGPENEFTNQNSTIATWNMLHLARMLKDAGGIPAFGNVPEEIDKAPHLGDDNPEYR